MKALFFCPKCKTAYSIETQDPEKEPSHECSKCKINLVYGECSMDEWVSKSAEEKAEIVSDIVERRLIAETSIEGLKLKHLKNIDKNIATIKGIVIFFTVLAIASAIITLIISWNS